MRKNSWLDIIKNNFKKIMIVNPQEYKHIKIKLKKKKSVNKKKS
jgi:hypothetical protein